ncbi:glutathione S-transferase family protein [Albidovulum sediminicola]|uniref:Glutathione S-transferase family protein n=1 Tax=Albidovulum sediminicola TaxID=2984331 RepID=A0ABT2Z404_9RHOB|nr:glutathione S-transferase family protein [Defluviimonas sp. WL0075]MCV2865888.1 glutathione S-transferase family protein [Defluviimonas sp. WL0075]
MRALLFTTGSPFARAVRILLDELELDYERREEITTPSVEDRVRATPTLQVPTFWDGVQTLWESGTIADYLLATYAHRPPAEPPLARDLFRPEAEWQDKLTFATIQTFGNAATTISQMKWGGIGLADSAHLQRSAEKLTTILRWLDNRLGGVGDGFQAGCASVQDIFLAAHVRFVQARPLGIDLDLRQFPKVSALLDRLDERDSFKANPIWWWEPGITGYQPDGTPIYGKAR